MAARPILDDLARAILEHVARYRITTADVVEDLFSNENPQAAVDALRRLERAGWLLDRPLHGRARFHQLSPRAAKFLGEDAHTATPPGAQTLPRLYAVLAFCCAGDRPRLRLTPREFRAKYPGLAAAGLPCSNIHDYFEDLEWPETPRLTRIVVDLGGDYRSFIEKLRSSVHDMRRIEGVSKLIAEERLGLALLFPEPSKCAAVRATIREKPLGLWVRDAVVDGLDQVLIHSLLREERVTPWSS